MLAASPTSSGAAPRWLGQPLWPVLLLILLSLPDLLAPPISPTIHRQTQTWVQMQQIVDSGLSWDAFSINITGPDPFRVIYECPIYQLLGAAVMAIAGTSWFWPKLISLLSTLVAVLCFRQWFAWHYGDSCGQRASLILGSIPIVLLLATAVQPDSLALACAAAMVVAHDRWCRRPSPGGWAWVLLAAAGALLIKVTIAIPFVPLLVWQHLTYQGRVRAPKLTHVLTVAVFVIAPFLWWMRIRSAHTAPEILVLDRGMFMVGDLARFLSPAFYLKPAFIVGAMVCAVVGVPLALLGLRRLQPAGWALCAGTPLYFFAVPTVADQTYYALPLAPIFALLVARGSIELEGIFRQSSGRQVACLSFAACWMLGLTLTIPYTLRRDGVTWAAARDLHDASARTQHALVLNMHDRGVGIGSYNPALLVLAERIGWTVTPQAAEREALESAIDDHLSHQARWLVVTWYTPGLEPWVNRLLPGSFSRQPRLRGIPVDGMPLVESLQKRYAMVRSGPNHAVFDLESQPTTGAP